jgi:sec-independent protein translocase protein TatA
MAALCRNQSLIAPIFLFNARNHFREETKMFEGIFQPMHLMIIAGIALLIFGPKKIPEFGKGLGEGIRGFKAAMQGKEETIPNDAASKAEEEKK